MNEMTVRQTGPLVENSYGLGLTVSQPGQIFGHGGAYKTNMTIDHDQIRIFLPQQASDWAKGNPSADFERWVRGLFGAFEDSGSADR